MSKPWFRFYDDFLGNKKIVQLQNTNPFAVVIYTYLLCLMNRERTKIINKFYNEEKKIRDEFEQSNEKVEEKLDKSLGEVREKLDFFLTSLKLKFDFLTLTTLLYTRKDRLKKALEALKDVGLISFEINDLTVKIKVIGWYKKQTISDISYIRVKRFRNRNETPKILDSRYIDKDINKKSIKKKVSDEELEARFESFWHNYPIKKGKQKAYKIFEKLKVDEELLQVIINAIGKQKQEHVDRKAKNMWSPEWKHPTTWLNAQCWNDEQNNEVNNNATNTKQSSAAIVIERALQRKAARRQQGVIENGQD